MGNGSVLPPKATGPAGALRRAEAHCALRDSFIRTWDDSLVVKNYSNRKGSDSADIEVYKAK